jgi:integrase
MYSVDQYLNMLKLAKRSDATIRSYRWTIGDFADVVGVPVEYIHNHLTPANLMKYASVQQQQSRSERAMSVRLRVLHRFFSVNGIKLDTMEMNVVRQRVTEEPEDKPLELDTLQKMMDLADIHGKAIISFLISTGCRAGELCKLRVDDVNGDTVKIRNEIAKGKHGRTAYLTTEAREYLDLWLRERPAYIKRARKRAYSQKYNLQADDPRLFFCGYSTLRQIWSKWYNAVDGDKGKYGQLRCTIHSARRYFRTHAVSQAFPIDMVERVMGHTGYLTGSYVRITDEEARKAFHAGESVLYITRADHRVQESKLSKLERTNEELSKKIKSMEGQQSVIEKMQKEMELFHRMSEAKNDPDTLVEYAEWLRAKAKTGKN